MRLTPFTTPAALAATGAVLAATALAAAAPAAHASPPRATVASATPTPPPVSPTPQKMTSLGAPIDVTSRVQLVTDAATDADAVREVRKVLATHGVTRVDSIAPGAPTLPGLLTIRLGGADRADIRAALGTTAVPDKTEAYAVRSTQSRSLKQVVLAGRDGSGQFYAVQTLRHLLTRSDGHSTVASVSVSDFPSMPLRGTIEGFYGDPWTPAERLDQIDFYGQVKANTYIYAPKDDPYHRGQWREPYPADKLAELGTLVKRASANKVHFTFAVSPGESICYSRASDRAALKAKLEAIYGLGARAFSIPLDDISYTRWNCAEDQAAFGAPGRQAAAKAQVSLLNDVQRTWIATHDGAQPLQMVPTEYGDLTETAYKKEIRETLDPAVVVMWTGTDVVPPSVTNEQADAIQELFGRKVFLWDNYPVNDFGNTAGRLLLAPYDKREAGLSDHLSGIVANPMNQSYASMVAVFGAADFTWNDTAYDATKSWPLAMAHLAGGDAAATEALLVFGDLEHMAPTFGATPWQPQAPVLAQKVKDFWATLDGGDPRGAVAELRAYAAQIAGAPATIRGGAVDDGFVTDAKPWLDATALWGRAMVLQMDAMTARLDGDAAKAESLTAESVALQGQAKAVKVTPAQNSWGEAPVKVGDGVLDAFLGKAAELVRSPIAITAPATVLLGDGGSVTVPAKVVNRLAGPVTDLQITASAAGATVTPTPVTIASLDSGESADVPITLTYAGAPQPRKVTLASKLAWTSASGPATGEGTTTVRASCALTPTRPVGATADSEETEGEDTPVTNAIDGDPKTFWGTQWYAASPTPPHQITLDLGAVKDTCAVTYLPRQDSANGRIGAYEVRTSTDGQTWSAPLATGTLPNSAAEQWIPFPVTSARYVRLVATREVQGRAWTTAAEVSIDAR